MISRLTAATLLGLASLLFIGDITTANEESAEGKFAATCPVSGKPAIESSSLDLPKGEGKVYFCCKNCPKAYKENPEKFELAVRRQLLETSQIAQVGCPISGQPVAEDASADAGNAKVSFCCEKCLAKYNKASDEDKLKIAFANLEKGFTRQTKCPVSGKPIKADHTAEYKGETVYFCCPNCPAAFEKDPEKFAAKLPQLKDDSASKE